MMVGSVAMVAVLVGKAGGLGDGGRDDRGKLPGARAAGQRPVAGCWRRWCS